jgi:hypothetical protein
MPDEHERRMFPTLQIASPTTVNLTVGQRQARRYLTEREIERGLWTVPVSTAAATAMPP